MVYKNKNFSRGKIDPLRAADGDTFDNCNFSRLKDTEILNGVSRLKFVNGCNVLNCRIPAGSLITKDCLIIKKSFCSHLHAEIKPKCGVKCSHLVETNKVIIDGAVVNTGYTYEDKVV